MYSTTIKIPQNFDFKNNKVWFLDSDTDKLRYGFVIEINYLLDEMMQEFSVLQNDEVFDV